MPRLVPLALLATLGLTVIVYWVGLHGPLVFDDAHNLAPINDWLEGRVGWRSVVFGNGSGLFGRSLSMASFVLNVALLGPATWGFKLGNLLIHLVNGALVFALFSGLIRLGALTRDSSRAARWLPWLGASIWLLHPLLVSTVLYVVQRMAMLSALFTLLALLAYLYGRVALTEQKWRRAYTLLAFVVPLCTVLAMLSKENGILAPALCGLVELIVFQPAVGERRHWQAKAFIGIALVLPALVAVILTFAQLSLITAGYANRPFTLVERLLTEARVLWDYLGAVLAPGGPRLGLYHDDYRISHDLLDPVRTLPALVGWAAIVLAGWRLRRIIPGLALGLGIFLVGQALESTVFPLLSYFEHRNYLPIVGAIWAILSVLAFIADAARQRTHNAAPIFGVAACTLVLVLAVATAQRANVWANQRSLLAQALLYHPDSKDARMDLIAQAMAQDPPAIAEARVHADHLRASNKPSTQRLGTVERVMIDCASGMAANPDLVHQMFGDRPGPIELELMLTFENLSDGIASQPCPGLSPAQMANGLSAMLDRSTLSASATEIWRLRYRAANLYLVANQTQDAIKQAKMAYANGAAQPQVTIFVAGLLLDDGDTAGATQMLDAAERQIRPDDILAHKLINDGRTKILAVEAAGILWRN